MGTKVCITCKIEKTLSCFSFRKDTKKLRNECKDCERIRKRKHYDNNIEKIKQRSKEFYYNNWDDIQQKKKEYRMKNIEKIREQDKKHYNENKEKIIKKSKEYYYEHKDKVKSRIQQYYQRNKKTIHDYKNGLKRKDQVYYLKCKIRNVIYASFKRKSFVKSLNCEVILGCDINTFINHLLQTYKNNYGIEWDGEEKVHIDHKIPLAIAKTEEEVMQLCNYKNLQLLKEKDNLEKGAKLNYELKGE